MFTLVNIVQISLASYRNATTIFTSEEQAFYDFVVPALEPYQVRRLLRVGEWHDAAPGTQLIEQGSVVSHLIFISSGKVDILYHGTALSSCGAGQLVGEISAVGTEMVPATASAVVSESIRYLALERGALERVKNSDPSILRAIEVCSRRSLRDKLMEMNALALN
jgi:CRP-like cAMP-binding protein